MQKSRMKTKTTTTKQVVIRFKNSRIPKEASRNADNLAAVCCPAFSL